MKAYLISGALVAVIAAGGAGYLKGHSDATRAALLAQMQSQTETGEAIDGAPIFNPGDPAARERLCALLGLSDCPMLGDTAKPQ